MWSWNDIKKAAVPTSVQDALFKLNPVTALPAWGNTIYRNWQKDQPQQSQTPQYGPDGYLTTTPQSEKDRMAGVIAQTQANANTQKQGSTLNPFGQTWLDIYGQTQDQITDPNAVGAQAQAAFNPALAALAAEKSGAKKRTKEYRKSSRQDYQALRAEYLAEKANSAKQEATDTAKANQDLAKGKAATSQEYSQVQANQASELAAAGLGGSAQTLAKQALQNQSMQALQDQEQMAQISNETRQQNSQITQSYLQGAAQNAIQAGNEQDYALITKLQDTLSALSGQEAQVRTQAAQSRLAAQQQATSNNIGINQNLLSLLNAGVNASQIVGNYAPDATNSYGKGGSEADRFLNDALRNPDQFKAVRQAITSSPLLSGTDRNVKPNAINVMPELAKIAEQTGVPYEIVSQYYDRLMGNYSDPKATKPTAVQ